MTEKERLEKIRELLKIYQEESPNQSVSENPSKNQAMGGKVRTMTNPITGNLRFTEPNSSENKKAAFSSAAMLGFMTLLFEGLFLIVSYFLFR